MRRTLRNWLAGAALATALVASAPAQAALVVESYRVTGSGFTDLFGLTAPPFATADVRFTLNFDRALQYVGSTSGITLNNSTLPLTSALGFSYSPITGTIFVGGNSAGVAGFTTLADDFAIVANIANPATPTAFSIGYTTAATPGSLFASFGSIAPVPEPATWAMMMFGFGAVGATMRRRRNRPGLALT
jgi:PEP-CTERM motif